MATTEFGAPIYAEPDLPTEQNGGTATPVDMNDPALTSEVIEDTTQDAYAIPPPPPDGKWRAKLKQVDINDPSDSQKKRHIVFVHPKMNDGKPFFAVNVEASLIDVSGKFDGISTTEYWVKSAVDKRKNVSEMSTITKAAGGAPLDRGNQTDRLNALEKVLAGEPEAIIDTFWEASCQTCQEAAKKKGDRSPRPFLMGMHRFPSKGAGVHDPMVQCPTCKSMVRAQMRIAGFFNVKEMKATRGIA